MFVLAALAVLGLASNGFAQADRFRGVAPHDVPHCSPKGGENSAPCRCLGMVHDVQTTKASECWAAEGVDVADGGVPAELRLFAPPGVKACLAHVPDHCRVVAQTPRWWGYSGKKHLPDKLQARALWLRGYGVQVACGE